MWDLEARALHLPPMFLYAPIFGETTPGAGLGGNFDGFKNWFRVQQHKWENQFRFFKEFHSTNGQFAKPDQNQHWFVILCWQQKHVAWLKEHMSQLMRLWY